jgi:uncharacterized protein YjlB
MFDRRGFVRPYALGPGNAGAAPIGAGASRATGEVALQSFTLRRSEWVPNNPRLPVLFYKNAITLVGEDPTALLEAAFTRNGWPTQWRNGVYDFHHYHSTAHEVLGFARAARASCLEAQRGAR